MKTQFNVAEGIYGTFYYHLRVSDEPFALCGDRIMHTSIPFSAWGTTTHVKERWCSRCANLEKEINHE